MKVCNEIKRRIDEADDVESFDFEVTRHTETCSDCRRFVGERAALRGLIASTARVTAPVNFEAMLQARLADVKADKPLAWLNATFYLRVGAATAALVVAVFVAQYYGLFTTSPTVPIKSADTNDKTVAAATGTSNQSASAKNQPPPSPAVDRLPKVDPLIARTGSAMAATPRLRAMNPRSGHVAAAPPVPLVDAAFVDSPAILIPGKNGERAITVPTVSVGAQSLIYSNASRQPQPTRAVTVSF